MTTRFCENANLEKTYVAVESRESLEDRNSNAWRYASWLFGSPPYWLEFIGTRGSPNRGRFTEPRERKRASLPDTEHMVSSVPAFGLTPSEKGTLDLITDHPMIPREHLARWLGVSEGRVSQMLHNLVRTWGLWSAGANGATSATHCRRRASATSPTGTGRSCRRHGESGARNSPRTTGVAIGAWATASRPGRGRPGTPTG